MPIVHRCECKDPTFITFRNSINIKGLDFIVKIGSTSHIDYQKADCNRANCHIKSK